MESLFSTFNGADLDRLADCIKAVRAAGLQTTKHTQAGVNQSSGNVWVWDEDWAGCVACSIGFDVHWWHSCPECGEEYSFDTYPELQDYIEKHDGQCEACKRRFVAGWNMPGYLPDSEPAEFDNPADALEYLKGEAKHAAETDADGMGWSEEDYRAALAEIDAWKADAEGEFGRTIGRFHYFVSRA